MAADAGMAPRPLRRALLGSGRRPVGPLAPRRPPGGRDAGRAAERRRTAQAGQQAGSRAFRDCHTRRPRAPYPVSAAWALIGRDLDSRVLIGVAKCSSLPPPALACNARSPPASKEGTVCGIARPKTPRVNSSQDQIQVASGNTRSGSRHQHPASGTRLPASCGQEVPLFSQQAVGGLEPREQSEAYTPASFLPCTW
uniref:Cytosolic iron-sulfur assembly component 1 n=2 Tax=Theropithecus gelada TaxID=9565 RepID=A0A8D2EYC1_THEGE